MFSRQVVCMGGDMLAGYGGAANWNNLMICPPKSGPINTATFQHVKISGKELSREEVAVYPRTNYLCP